MAALAHACISCLLPLTRDSVADVSWLPARTAPAGPPGARRRPGEAARPAVAGPSLTFSRLGLVLRVRQARRSEGSSALGLSRSACCGRLQEQEALEKKTAALRKREQELAAREAKLEKMQVCARGRRACARERGTQIDRERRRDGGDAVAGHATKLG